MDTEAIGVLIVSILLLLFSAAMLLGLFLVIVGSFQAAEKTANNIFRNCFNNPENGADS